MEVHPYSGAQYATTNAPQAQAPAMPSKAIETMTSGMQAVNQHAHSFEDAIYDRVEYAVDQQHKLYMQQTQAIVERNLTEALTAPDGSAGSLWNSDGSFRNDYYNQLVSSQMALFNGLQNGYVRPESKTAATAAVNELKAKIKTSIDVRVTESIAPRAKSATLNLAKWQAEQGDYISAAATIQGAPDFAVSQFEKDQALKDIEQRRIMNTAKSAVLFNDAETYLNIVTNKDTMNGMTPEQQHALINMRSRFADTDPPPGRGTSDSGKKEKKAAKPLPLGVTDDLITLHDSWLDDNGNYPPTGEARRLAIDLLDNYIARFVYPDLTEKDRLYLQSIGASFGFSKEDTNIFIDKNMQPFQMTRGKFDFNKALDDIPDAFFTPVAAVNALNEASAAIDAVRDKRIRHKLGTDYFKDEAEAADMAYERVKDTLNEHIAYQRGLVRQQFADWIDAQGKDKPTDIEMRMKLFDIVDELGDANVSNFHGNPYDISRSRAYRNLQEEYNSAMDARKEGETTRKALEEETAHVDHAIIMKNLDAFLHQTDYLTPSSFYVFANDASKLPNTNAEAYLAVPNGSPLDGKTLAIKYNGRTRPIICRTAEVSEPTLSANARLKMGLLNSNTAFTVAHDAEGNAIMTAQSITPKETNMYDIMLSNEARTDANGRPQIYKLPAGDGGGNFEVAGLNEKSNPAELAHVKQMLKENRPTEEVVGYIKSVYKQKTNYAAQLIPDSCSQGIELTIRDCALNHSPGGVSTILKNAIGIPNTPEISTLKLKDEVAKFVRTHGEKTFLYNLSVARANYYRKLVVDKPERAKFLKGWLNRNQKVYASSQSLLSTPR